MRPSIFLALLFLLCAASSYSQTEMAPPQPVVPIVNAGLRTNNEVTPRWTLEAALRYGRLKQDIQTHNLSQAYDGSLKTSGYTGISFTPGRSFGGDLSLNYFFTRKHTFGLGIGALFMENTGTLTMDSIRADFRAQDNEKRTFRQIITSNGPITEDVTIRTVGVPLLLKFKNQFKGQFGVWADVGPVVSFYNQTRATVTAASFDYEAIYRLSRESSAVVSGFDETPTGDQFTSLILTQQHHKESHSSESAESYFNALRSAGYMVGLDQRVAQAQTTPEHKYDKLSLGGLVQAGVSWEVAYRMSFSLGGYYMMNRFGNKGGESNHITDELVSESGAGATSVSNYKGLSNVIKQADYRSYGLMAGFRFFIGGKGRDRDGDGYIDDKDGCPAESGTINGCPDNDGDNIPNDEDECKDVPGLSITRGCPDTDMDGVADKDDSCMYEPGNFQGCPRKYFENKPPDTTLIASNGLILAPHIVLESDVLLFPFGKATLEPEALKILDDAANTLAKEPKVIIHISGHTDDVGTYANNLVLSVDRAKAAKNYLMERGVFEKRIIIAGLGKDFPVTTNDSEENRAKNRRIDLRLLLPVESEK